MTENEKWIAIGDIHGCPDQLLEILKASKSFPDHKLVFLGDFIDRGPEPEKVIEIVRSLDAVFLRGNHEQMLLDRVDLSEEMKNETLKIASISQSSLQWMRHSTVGKFETEEYVFVHAGLNSEKEMSEQTDWDYMWSINDGAYLAQTRKLVIHGHLVVEDVVRVENRININTGCGSGGYLTGLVLPEMTILRSSLSPGHEMDIKRYLAMLDEDLDEI